MRKTFSIAGSVLLVVCFFLPMVRGCGEDVSPFSHAREGATHILRGDIESIPMFAGLLTPHLFGLLVLLATIILMTKKRITKIIGVFYWGILILGCILTLCVLIAPIFNNWPIHIDMESKDDVTGAAYVLLAAAYSILIPVIVIRILKMPQSSLIIIPVIQKLLALMSFLWFLYWLVVFRGDTLYGIYVALAACVLVYLGASLFTMPSDNKQLTE